MEFKELSYQDRHLFNNIDYLCSDYVFSYLYMFSDAYKLRIYHDDNTIIIRSGICKPVFYMPLGDVDRGIETVQDYCCTKKIKPVFTKVTEKFMNIFSDHNLILEEDRDSFDYIYKTSDLIKLEGSEYRNQRNNISNYLKNFTPSYSSDIKDHINECVSFTSEYYGKKKDVLIPTLKLLEKYDELGLNGGIVWNDAKIQAYCIYEKVSDDTVMSHVELSDNSHRGIHAYMINEMSKLIDSEYINKEDDMGLAGLRRFKQTYNPDTLLKKFKASAAV